MNNTLLQDYLIDYVEIYTPMAKALAYWHTHALGFRVTAVSDFESGSPGRSSYVLQSGDIRLVLTSAYPSGQPVNSEVASFIAQNYCGVKRVALRVPSVTGVFEKSVEGGAIPVRFPSSLEDESGFVEEASIKLYDQNEIVFVNRDSYRGIFKPGYTQRQQGGDGRNDQSPAGAAAGSSDLPGSVAALKAIDHIAGELRINEINFWTRYLTGAIGTALVQHIKRSEENKTGMILNINQSPDKRLTLVMAEPDTYLQKSKIQQNIEKFGPGIHHLAFATDDIIQTIREFTGRQVEFVSFPPSYYDLLRNSQEFDGIDIDQLQHYGILIDKEDDSYLLQKFIKPISDRPFFLYEIVQRVNGYGGFALKNINVLKRAEELEIMRTA